MLSTYCTSLQIISLLVFTALELFCHSQSCRWLSDIKTLSLSSFDGFPFSLQNKTRLAPICNSIPLLKINLYFLPFPPLNCFIASAGFPHRSKIKSLTRVHFYLRMKDFNFFWILSFNSGRAQDLYLKRYTLGYSSARQSGKTSDLVAEVTKDSAQAQCSWPASFCK